MAIITKHFPLFVYGTLQTTERNYGWFDGKVRKVETAYIGPAQIWTNGNLPFLELGNIEPKPVLGCYGDLEADKRNYLESVKLYTSNVKKNIITMTNILIMAQDLGRYWPKPFRLVEGQLMILPLDQKLITALDRFEGFTESPDNTYVRQLVPITLNDKTIIPAWVYALNDLNPMKGFDYYPHDRWCEKMALTLQNGVW